MKKTLLTLVALAAMSVPALAESPVLRPQTGFKGQAEIYDAKSGMRMPMTVRGEGHYMRSEMTPRPGMTMTSVINHETGKLVSWMTGGPMAAMGNYYMEMDASEAGSPMTSLADAEDKIDFTKQGSATVAGEDCTLWHGQPKDGSPAGTACITDDGLTLQMVIDGQAEPVFKMTSISRGDQDDSLFSPPPGSQPMPFKMPNMGGMMGMPGMQ